MAKRPEGGIVMSEPKLSGIEFMGENLKEKVAYWGGGVRCFPLSKIIHPEMAKLDDHCEIFDFAFIDAGRGLTIGKYTTITWTVVIEGGERTFIGDRVLIGPGAKILNRIGQIQGYYSVPHLPLGAHKVIRGDVIIEDDAYIGANAVVMPGVTIGEGAVVGASSFVKKDIEPWSIYAGIPCKKIGEREKPGAEIREKVNTAVNWSNKLYDFNMPRVPIHESFEDFHNIWSDKTSIN